MSHEFLKDPETRINIGKAIKDIINEQTKKDLAESEYERGHLGASIIGKECARQVQYSFRWFGKKDFPASVLRLFERGKREEERMMNMLRSIGCTVHTVDPVTGKQFRIPEIDGHFGGSTDGIIEFPAHANLPRMVGECKTYNLHNFRRVLKDGVKIAYPLYFGQMSIYGWFFNIPYGLHFGEGKNDDDIVINIVELDFELAKQLYEKATHIITSKNIIPRFRDANPMHKECKMCDQADLCFGNKQPLVNCRTCRFSTPVFGGGWSCDLHNIELTKQMQIEACGDWSDITKL